MKIKRRVGSGERGLTLLELTVVTAILGIMAAMTAVVVSGSAGRSRDVALTTDKAEVEKAVSNYAGNHPRGQYPTINGCLPGQTKQSDGSCTAATVAAGAFNVADRTTWEAILWDKAFKSGQQTLRLVPDYLSVGLKQAQWHSDGTTWTRTLADPDGVSSTALAAPDCTGSQDTACTSSSKIPVWMLDKYGKVQTSIKPSSY
ncbi:MAG: type II secretion system protein [Chloroflexi bacterium]|nr:type II secretion system protein [Chloroflexota bacterium]